MAADVPPHTVSFPALLQWWRAPAFLHWVADPERIAELLPAGLEPDVHAGRAWAGLTPFRVEGQRLTGLPALPVVSAYGEANIRTYVRGPDGDGLWFMALHAASRPTVVAGRATIAAPYHRSAVHIARTGRGWSYAIGQGRDAFSVEVDPEPGAAVDHSELATFLTGRWRAYTWHPRAGLLRVNVTHPPWRPRPAVARWHGRPASVLHLATAPEVAVAHLADDVHARLGPPVPVGRCL
jgi:uncharacterized protein